MRNGVFVLLLAFMIVTSSPIKAMEADSHGAQQAVEGATHVQGHPDPLDEHMQMSTAHEVEGDHGGGGGLPQFDPSSYASQVFWLVIAFALLYVFFSKKTLPQIGAILQIREAHIQSNLDAAQGLKDKAEAARESYEAALKDSQEKSAAMFAQIDQEIKKETAAKFDAFQNRASAEIDATEKEIEKAKKEAMDSVQSIAAEIASMAAEKIVGISADLDQAKTAVQKIKKAA